MAEVYGAKFHYDDHDSDVVNEAPPVQNTWYECFDAEDVRLIWCVVRQTNDESAAKDVEIRWTVDGNVYFISLAIDHNTYVYIFRYFLPSSGGTAGLSATSTIHNAAWEVDKRGKEFKTEIRMTGVPGTNQVLNMWCVRETEDLT